jgi:hypothetical protein
MTKKSLFSLVCFEGEDDAAAAAAAAAAAQTGTGGTFNQDDVNKFLAEDRRKHVEKFKQLESSYQGILQDKTLASEQRSRLQTELEDLQKSFRTKEQQMEFEKKQAASKYENELGELKGRATKWEAMYKDQVIQTSLQGAAASGEAFNPTQIIGLLRPMTELRDEIDGDGKSTGKIVPMIDFPDIDEKTGENIKTLRSPQDAVKRMKELPQLYGNLFKANVVSGVGSGSAAGGSGSGGGKVDVSKLTADQYRKLRAEHPEQLGLRKRTK